MELTFLFLPPSLRFLLSFWEVLFNYWVQGWEGVDRFLFYLYFELTRITLLIIASATAAIATIYLLQKS